VNINALLTHSALIFATVLAVSMCCSYQFKLPLVYQAHTASHLCAGEPLNVHWDCEVSFFGCGLPLADCLEDTALAALTRLLLKSFNRANPLHLDFAQMAEVAHASSQHGRLDSPV